MTQKKSSETINDNSVIIREIIHKIIKSLVYSVNHIHHKQNKLFLRLTYGINEQRNYSTTGISQHIFLSIPNISL